MVYCVYGVLVACVGVALGLLIHAESERYVLGWMIHLRWVAGAVCLAGMAVALFGFFLQLRIVLDRVGRARARGEGERELPDTSGHEREPPPGSP
jgi:hypothetical protein